MKASLLNKLDILQDRFEELTALLGDAEVIAKQAQFRAYSKEYAEIEPVIATFRELRKVQGDLEGAQALLKDSDPDLREMAELEVDQAKEALVVLEDKLQRMLLPKDPNDGRNVYLEIRAGTGGDEAAIFSGDLFRMYSRYAEKQGWRVEVLSANEGEHGGFKEVIARVEGDNVYAKLKFESGAHRVQRVPETESQGRIHTSAAGVLVLPEVDAPDEVHLDPNDLKVDVFRSSGPGGQSVNTTDSAVRLTHLPTGIVVSMQNEKSQIQNREAALRVLRSRLLERQRAEQDAEDSAARAAQVRTMDRSERIRTYNFPENRIADHRTGYKAHNLDAVLDGDLEAVIASCLALDEERRLAALGGDA